MGPFFNSPGSHDIDIRVWSTATALTISGSDCGGPSSAVIITKLCSEYSSISRNDDSINATLNCEYRKSYFSKLTAEKRLDLVQSEKNLLYILCMAASFLHELWCYLPYFDFDSISNHCHSLHIAIAPNSFLAHFSDVSLYLTNDLGSPIPMIKMSMSTSQPKELVLVVFQFWLKNSNVQTNWVSFI